MAFRNFLLTLALAAMAALVVGVSGCGSGNGSSGGSLSGGMGAQGTATVTISDPAPCAAPNGPFSHVFVTVADVKASTNGNAGPNDSSFVDLTPGLTPTQVDLLSTPSTQCFLAQLSNGTNIPAGDYQQIRIFLLDNNTNTPPAGNQCGTAVNCVVLTSDGTVHPLQLSSEATTGIKIPSGQIAGGKFSIAAGQTANLNIDFNACESIVLRPNGNYQLKPVLHAGEVSLTAGAISGNVVDSVTAAAINGGTTMVALEQKDASGVDRVLLETTADSTGAFNLCPLAQGSYDVVIDAVDSTGKVYAATITTGVSPGTTLKNIPLIATTTAAATISGIANTTGASGPTSADVSVSALQTANGTPFTIPLASQLETSAVVTTAAGGSCAANSDCATYTLNVPVANPDVGASGGSYTQAGGAVNYTIDGLAFVPGTPATPDCLNASNLPEDMQVAANAVVAGTNPQPAAMNFTGCQ